jgi:hypothetical protein
MSTRFVISAILYFSGLILLCCSAQAAEQGDYLGADACRTCHKSLWDRWQKTGHAKAYESLKKSNQQELPDCLRCHTTAYAEGGYIDHELTPELSGVQCEVCHGAGKNHITAPGKKDVMKRKPAESTCRSCHTIKQDPKFDFSGKKKLVH